MVTSQSQVRTEQTSVQNGQSNDDLGYDGPIHHSSYIEILSQTQNIDNLDVRIRINLQEALIQFIKDENKWSTLPMLEQNRLLQKLATRSQQHNLFSEVISIRCFDEKGNLITRQANLLLDTTRNQNLSKIFDQIVNQHVARAFYEQFYFGLVDHLDRLFTLEQKLMVLEDAETDNHMLPITYFELQEDFLPLSQKDLQLIRDNGLGIMVQLIPRFLRMPLNRLYFTISRKTRDFPSLALQFYLDYYFSALENRDEFAESRRSLIRTFFTKAFYAIVRLGGLKMSHLELPEASRDERFQYITRRDDDDTRVLESSKALNLDTAEVIPVRDFAAIIKELEQLREKERQLKQRREVLGPAIKVELTLDKMLADIFQICRDECAVDIVDEADYFAKTLWIPQKLHPLTVWEREELSHYLDRVTDPEFVEVLPTREKEHIGYWESLAEAEATNEQTLAQLEALNYTEDIATFKAELKIRLAERHQDIVEQNKEIIIKEISKHITRMLRYGSITAEMVVRDRYDAFAENVLPYIYFFSLTNAKDEMLWIPSPYPMSKLLYLIHQVESMVSLADSVTLALARTLMEEILQLECKKLEASDYPSHISQEALIPHSDEPAD